MNFKFIFWRKSVSLLFRLFVFSTIVLAQPSDTVSSMKGEAEVDYFDFLRQKTSVSTTTVFFKNIYASFAYSFGGDTMQLKYQSEIQSIQYSNLSSMWSSTIRNQSTRGECFWKSRTPFFDYAVSLSVPLKGSIRSVGFSLLVKTPSLENFFIELEYSKTYADNFSSAFQFQDFFIQTNGFRKVTAGGCLFQFSPVEALHMSILTKYTTEIPENSAKEFDAEFTNDFFVRELNGDCAILKDLSAFGGALIAENRSSLLLQNNEQSFGNAPRTALSVYGFSGGVKYSVWKNNYAVSYGYHSYALSGAGVIESWPFTSLAASVIANRLLFAYQGELYIRSVDASANIFFSGQKFHPTVSYLTITPQLTLKHWQPELLVFGAKNISYENLTIERVQLLKIGIEYTMPTSVCEISITAEQYLPLAITRRKSNDGNTTTPSPEQNTNIVGVNSTDGGRLLKIKISL
jgi:hypothetical protein